MEEESVLVAMERLEKQLDHDLGFQWWKKCIAAGFWSNVTTTVSLSMTLLTALTTAQTTTSNLLSQGVFVGLSIFSLVVTFVNTFFRPHDQNTMMIKSMYAYQRFGTMFEEIYFTDNNDPADYQRRFDDYKKLQTEINKYKNENSTPESQSYLSDLLHYIASALFLKERSKWLNYSPDAPPPPTPSPLPTPALVPVPASTVAVTLESV